MTAILKVDTIQDTSGNNIINESSDTITIGASGDTIALAGTTVTGITQGITMADQWRLTTTFTGNASPIATNLERNDSVGYGKIGTGMSESSGIFTFPSTGLYYIDFTGFVVGTGGASYLGGGIHGTTDNSSYNSMAQNFTNTQGNTDHANFRCHTSFNVTNTSTHKVRFFQFSQNATGRLESDANQVRTGFTFMRIGD